MEETKPRFSIESLDCLSLTRNKVLGSSREIGWSSLLIDHLQGQGDSGVYDKHVTSDLGIVICMTGEYSLSVYRGGGSHEIGQTAGSIGLTQSEESNRLRWESRPKGIFTTASIYLPHHLHLQAAEHFRRAGLPLQREAVPAKVLDGDVIRSTASTLLKAMRSDFPDLYAEQASLWLVSHLVYLGVGARRPESDPRSPGFISDRRLSRVIEYMSANLGCQLTIAQLASEAGISPFHFSRLFKQVSGVSPHVYLTRLRMSSAKTLLATTDMAISQIAYECGYLTPSAFAAAFTRRFGAPPKSVRSAAGL